VRERECHLEERVVAPVAGDEMNALPAARLQYRIDARIVRNAVGTGTRCGSDPELLASQEPQQVDRMGSVVDDAAAVECGTAAPRAPSPFSDLRAQRHHRRIPAPKIGNRQRLSGPPEALNDPSSGRRIAAKRLFGENRTHGHIQKPIECGHVRRRRHADAGDIVNGAVRKCLVERDIGALERPARSEIRAYMRIRFDTGDKRETRIAAVG